MSNRDNANGNALYASGSQLWRANSLGLLELRESPGHPIPRATLKELLGAAVRAGFVAARGSRRAQAVKLLRRRRPEPEPIDTTAEWEELLHQYRTWAPRSVVRARYHAEARQRQKARAGTNAPPTKGTSQSRSSGDSTGQTSTAPR